MFMQKIIFIPIGFLASFLFVYLLFKKLRYLNYKEERVFDFIFANLAFWWLTIASHFYGLIPLILIFNVWYILGQKSWQLALSLSSLVQAWLVFMAVILGGAFFVFKLPYFVMPLSVALLVVFMILSVGNETIENLGPKITAKIKKRRKRAFKKP